MRPSPQFSAKPNKRSRSSKGMLGTISPLSVMYCLLCWVSFLVQSSRNLICCWVFFVVPCNMFSSQRYFCSLRFVREFWPHVPFSRPFSISSKTACLSKRAKFFSKSKSSTKISKSLKQSWFFWRWWSAFLGVVALRLWRTQLTSDAEEKQNKI